MARKTTAAQLRLKPKTDLLFVRIAFDELEACDKIAARLGLRRAEAIRHLIGQELGRSAPAPKTSASKYPKKHQLFIRISPEEMRVLDKIAKKRRVKRAEMVRLLIREEHVRQKR